MGAYKKCIMLRLNWYRSVNIQVQWTGWVKISFSVLDHLVFLTFLLAFVRIRFNLTQDLLLIHTPTT